MTFLLAIKIIGWTVVAGNIIAGSLIVLLSYANHQVHQRLRRGTWG